MSAHRELADYIDRKYSAMPMGADYVPKKHLSYYVYRDKLISKMTHNECAKFLREIAAGGDR